ncbi:MAG: hypothetical protein ABI885_22730 [Gammaproteobacteria bacterium]
MPRNRHNAMAPVDAATWLVIEDRYRTPISLKELAPGTDPRMIMIAAMARSIGKGWEVEELPGTQPLYFCRKDGDRRMVTISRRHPDDKGIAPSNSGNQRAEPADNVTPLRPNRD